MQKKRQPVNANDFSIFDSNTKHHYLESAFHGKIIIAVKQSYMAFYKKSQILLGLKKGTRICYAENNGEFLVGVIPFDSKINGYTVTQTKKSFSFYASCAFLVKKGLKPGYYEISESINIHEIDWYYLDLVQPFDNKLTK